jgi:uncharacterized protein
VTIELREHREGVGFLVHVTPGAKRPSVGGIHDGALRVSVTAAAEKGKANRAVIEALCDALDLRRAQCQVIAGETSRRKTILVTEVSCQSLRDKISQLGEPNR